MGQVKKRKGCRPPLLAFVVLLAREF